MLSVLIPTYNYNVYPLVKEVHKQLQKTGIFFEILVGDDASTQTFETLQLVNNLPYVRCFVHKKNKGREANRQFLANNATYEKLLFLDADVFLKDRFYMSKLLKTIQQEADVYFGGISVSNQLPATDKILRWKFGKERENVSVSERKLKPYLHLNSGAFVIKKNIFINLNKELVALNIYGLDAYFSYLLKKNQAKIIHYNNPVVHLGLEPNAIFLQKTEASLKTYKYLIDNKLMPFSYIKLTNLAGKLYTYQLKTLLSLFYTVSNGFLRKNLLSTKPSLRFFDMYRLLYFFHLK